MTSSRKLLIIVLTVFSFGWSFPFTKPKKDDKLADAIDLTKLPSRNETMISHQRISNAEECTNIGEVGTCICTQQNHPDGCLCSRNYNPLSCTCPDTPADLLGIDETQCKCVEGDLRTECEGYHYQPEDEIFFPHYEFDKDGKYIVSTYDGRQVFDRISMFDIDRIGDLPVDESYYAFPAESTIEELKVSQSLNFSIEDCNAKRLLYEQYYRFLGYAAYAYLGEDIAPSFVYALMNAPREGTKIDIQDPRENEPIGVERGCNQIQEDSLDENIYVGFEKDGIVDSSCVNNSQEIPHSTINDAQDNLPVPTRCADSTEINHYLKGLKIGLIQEVSTWNLLSYITRVGPVIGKLRYISNRGRGTPELAPVEGIIIGWKYVEGEIRWIMVQQNGDQQAIKEVPGDVQLSSDSYYGQFTGKVVFFMQLKDGMCTSNEKIVDSTCICTLQYHPDGCICSKQYNQQSCTCPNTPEALYDFDEIQCKCVEGDLRYECEGYHYQPEDEIFIPHYEFDQDGKYIVSTYDGRKVYGRVSIYDIDRLGAISVDDQYYVSPAESTIELLKVSKQLDFDKEECRAKKYLYEQYYKLLGYAAYTYLREDIAPSLVYALMNAPRKGTKIDIQDPRVNEPFDVERGCGWFELDENLYVGFEKDGIVDISCIPNSQDIPFSTIYDGQDRLPAATRCANQKEINHYLKGLKIGLIQEVSTSRLLEYITRVGPAIGKLRYISERDKGSADVPEVEGIIIGWKQVEGKIRWIMVQQNGDQQAIQEVPSEEQLSSDRYYGYFTGKVVFYKYPQITKPPTEEPPIDDSPIVTENKTDIEVGAKDRADDGTNKIWYDFTGLAGLIFPLIVCLSSTDSPNEIYEQTNTIEIEGNSALVLQSISEGEDLSVLRATSHSSEEDIDVPSLVHISGDAQMELNSFIIEHSHDSVDPLLRTEGYSLFRLIGVTLSGQKRRRDKETDTIVIDSQQQGQFQSPFLEARGKKVVMKNVVVEPTNFVDCNAIDINGGSNDAFNRQLLTEDSTFQQWNDINGGKSYLNLNKFTAVFKNSHFQGVDLNAVNANKQRINAVTKQTCDWNTASVNIDNSTGYFDNVTFDNLGEGALKVGNNAIATLKESVQFYKKYPIQGTDASQLTPRNIVCGKDGDLPAQLLAESSSFKEAGTDGSSIGGSISKNKWISADKDNCKITGTLNDEKFLLFTPEIQSITAKGNNDKTGIDVELKGKSLFKCGKLFLMVSLQPKYSKNADDITSKEYPLEDVAQTWDSEESVIATIKEDELIKKGAKLSVSVRMETKDGSHSEAEVTGDGKSSTDVEGFGKGGLSTGALIGIIVAAVVVVIVLVVLIIVCCYCCTKKSKKSSSSEKNQSSEGVEMKSNKW